MDDCATVRVALAGVLELAGFEVETAADGRSGLEAALRLLPDAVLLDVRMPGARDPGTVRGGEELLRKIKADPRLSSAPVFMLTGEPGERSAQALRRLGAAGYFAKPYDPEAVVRAIWGAVRPPGGESR